MPLNLKEDKDDEETQSTSAPANATKVKRPKRRTEKSSAYWSRRLRRDENLIECGLFTLSREPKTYFYCTDASCLNEPKKFNSMAFFIQHVKNFHPEITVKKEEPNVNSSIATVTDEIPKHKKLRKNNFDKSSSQQEIKMDLIPEVNENHFVEITIDKKLKSTHNENGMKRNKLKIKSDKKSNTKRSRRRRKNSAEFSSDDDKPLSLQQQKSNLASSNTNHETQLEAKVVTSALIQEENEIYLKTTNKAKQTLVKNDFKAELKSEDEMDLIENNSDEDDNISDFYNEDSHNDSDTSEIFFEKSNNQEGKQNNVSKKKEIATTDKAHISKVKIHKCNSCDTIFKSARSLNSHRDSEVCVKTDDNIPAVSNEISAKNFFGMFSCLVCKSTYDNLQELLKHEKTHTKVEKYGEICKICGKELKVNSFKEHMTQHSTGQPFQCMQCPKAFYNKYALQTHEKMHNTSNKSKLKRKVKCDVKCEICGILLSKKSDLKKHVMHDHSNEAELCVCDLCGKQFPSQSFLKHHMRKHLKPITQNYCCDVCNLTFLNKKDFKKHKAAHKLIN